MILYLAIRHLLAKKSQTILVLLGISLGTTIYIVIAGVQKGMQAYVIDQLLSNMPHISIRAREEKIEVNDLTVRLFGPKTLVRWLIAPSGRRDEEHIEYPQGWFDHLQQDPNVLGYSPGLTVSAIVSHGSVRLPIQIYGVVPERYAQMTDISEYMVKGRFLDLVSGSGKIILGFDLAEKLGAMLDDTVQVSLGQGQPQPLKVAGIFKVTMEVVNQSMTYTSLQDVQKLNRSPGRIGTISVNLVDPMKAKTLSKEWSILSRDQVKSWEEVSSNFLQIFTIQNITRMIITISILTVAAFGIYNVLSIMVSQKRREIAILQSIGYPPQQILGLFLVQGVILGTIGAVIGLILGHIANLGIGKIELGFETPMGNHLMISYELGHYLTGFLLAFVSAIGASFLPARTASRLTPLDIIRSEV